MQWSIQDLGAIGEFVGAFAVVGTLIYLTLQVRQSTVQARLTSIQAVNASNDSAFNPIYIPENTRIWTVGLENPDALEQGEWRIFGLLMTRLIASFDTPPTNLNMVRTIRIYMTECQRFTDPWFPHPVAENGTKPISIYSLVQFSSDWRISFPAPAVILRRDDGNVLSNDSEKSQFP